MSGRDIPTRQKTLSVAFSVIMVLSVMAMGMAGFAGSAAALQDPAQDDQFGSLVVTNGPAETGQSSATIVATTVVDSNSDLLTPSTASLQDVNITVSGEDGSSIDPTSDITANSDIELEVIKPNGQVRSYAGSYPITGGDSEADALTSNDPAVAGIQNIEESTAGNVEIAAGDKIRLKIKNGVDLGELSGSSLDVTMGVNTANDGGSSIDASETVDLSADVPGPVKLESGGSTTSYSTITDALSAASSDDTITVGEGQYDGLGSTLAVSSTDGVTIQAASGASPEVIIDAEAGESGKESQLFVQDSENVTVDGINFVGNYNSTRDIVGAADNKEGRQIAFENAANATLQNVQITNDLTGASDNALQHIIYATGTDDLTINSSSTVNVTTGSSSTLDRQIINIDGDRAEITGSTIVENADSPRETAIQVGSGTDDEGPASITNNNIEAGSGVYVAQQDVEVSGSTITTHSGSAVSVGDGTNTDGLLVQDNTITYKGSSSDNGVIVGSGDKVDVDGNTIEGYDVGVQLASSGTNDLGTVNVTGGEIINSSSTAVDLTNNDGYTSDAEITIDGVTIYSEDSSSDGVNIGASTSSGNIKSVDVNNIDVQGPQTSAGVIVDLGSADPDYDVNVTNSQFVNATTGIQINNWDVDLAEGQFNAHFNTFENNEDGVFVDTGASLGNSDQVLNLTFNDFVGNSDNGLEAEDYTSADDATINANYSWWDNRDSSRIVGPYTPQNAGSQLPIPRRVYSYTRLHTGGQP